MSKVKECYWTKTALIREESVQYLEPLNCPEAVLKLVNNKLDLENADQEYMVGLYLSTKLYPNVLQVLSIGTAETTMVSPKEIFKPAFLSSSTRIILVHNHPSGIPTPSEEDRAFTLRICEAGKLLEIPLVDHLIIGYGKWYSFRDLIEQFQNKRRR